MISCIPTDTLLKNYNYAVRYVQADSTFDVQIIYGNRQRSLGYAFDCDAPGYIIPRFDWCSDSVVALIAGCGGNYCTHNSYFIPRTGKYLFYDNVFTYQKSNSLIAYINENDSLVITDLLTERSVSYQLPSNMPCANKLQCLVRGKFLGNKLSVSWQVLQNNKEIVMKKRYYFQK